MNEECILCSRIAEVSKVPGWGEYSVECATCGNYTYDDFFKTAYTSIEKDKRAMISAYTRECFELGMEPPKLGNPDHLKEKIEEYKNKTIEEKLDNLILYLKKKSSYLGDCVAWDEKKDYPITYSPYPQEFTKIRNLAKERNLLYWKSRDSGLELSGEAWELAEKLEKEPEMEIGRKSGQFLKALYELTEGNENNIRDMWKIGKSLGFPNSLTNKIGQYLEGEKFIIFRTDQGEISIKHNGVKKVENALSKKDEVEPKDKKIKADPKKVFVVHGRNEKARRAMFDFLRSVDLKPIEWEEAVRLTGEGASFPQQVLDKAFETAQAIIILITGDDIAKMRDEFILPKDTKYERNLSIQARPNVIFEAGLAFGRDPKRTILVELEKENTRPFSDIYGRLTVRLSNKVESRKKLIDRLSTVGCETNIDAKQDWITTGDFDCAVIKFKGNEKINIPSKENRYNKIIHDLPEYYFEVLEFIADQPDSSINEDNIFKYFESKKKSKVELNIMKAQFEDNRLIIIPDPGYGVMRWRITRHALLILDHYRKKKK